MITIMASSSVFIIPDASKKEADNTPFIAFDAVTRFSPVRSRNLSHSPVSKGSFVSEILSDNSGKVTMEAYVSNNPIIIKQNNLVDKQKTDIRSQAAYYALDTLYKSKDTVNIQYKFDKNLESYILKDFETILLPSDTIGFRLSFEEVRFATEKRVELTFNMSDDKVKDSIPNENTGGASTEGVTTKETGFLYKILPDRVAAVATEVFN